MALFHRKYWLVVPCVFGAAAIEAAGLGGLSLGSRLGQPLQVEIDVYANPGEKIDASCFRLDRPRPDEGELPWLVRGQLALKPTANGQRLVVTTPTAMREPILRMAVRVGCGAEVIREYSILLSPEDERPYVVTPAALVAAESRPRPAEPAGFPGEPVGLAVGAADTPESIARGLYPTSRRMQRRFVEAFIAANPALDLKPGMPIPPAVPVVMPDLRQLVATAAEARAPVSSPLPVRPPPAKRREGLQVADRLRIGGGSQTGPIEVGEPRLRLATELLDGLAHGLAGVDTGLSRTTVSESQRDIFRVEYRLLSAANPAAGQASDPAERQRLLEQRAADYRKLADLLDGKPPVVNLPTAAPPPEPARPAASATPPGPPPAPASPWNDWLLYAGGGLSIALLAGYLLHRRRREPAPAEEFFATPETEPTADLPPPPVFAAALAGEAAVPPAFATLPAAGEPGVAAAVTAEAPAAVRAPPPAPRQNPAVDDLAVSQELGVEDNNVVELADIMLAFGRVKGAAEILNEFIEEAPREALQPWIKLLDVYRANGMRKEFEEISTRLHKTYNVEVERWEQDAAVAVTAEGTPAPARDLEEFAHLMTSINALWGTTEGLEYLRKLLHDNRDGERIGFPREVAEEILFLSEVLATELGSRTNSFGIAIP